MGNVDGMKTTIDRAGRVVLPKALRDEIGLAPGEVEVYVDGATIRIEPVYRTDVEIVDGRMVLPAMGDPITDEQIRELRFADQR